MSTPPQISPDGHYWWDGQAWRPMPDAAPAPAPAPPVTTEAPPSWLAAPPQAAAPAAPEPPAGVVEPSAPAPVWATPQPPASRTWIYMTGFMMIAIIAIGAFVVYPMLKPSANVTASVQVSPTPLLSDYERADRFLNVDLAPSLATSNEALPPVTSKCTSTLPPPCKDALIALDKAMTEVDEAMTTSGSKLFASWRASRYRRARKVHILRMRPRPMPRYAGVAYQVYLEENAALSKAGVATVGPGEAKDLGDLPVSRIIPP